MSVSFSLSRAGLEVYTTSNNEEISLSDSTDSSANFTLQNGDVTQIDYIGELFSDNFEQDYSDISSNASIVLPMDYYSLLFKGRKVSLKKGRDSKKWENMDTALIGFVTELSYSKDKIDVKINGMNKLLDQNKKFEFKKTRRSKIVKEIIESSGLKANINVTGLIDDITDFTNISSGSDGSSDGIQSTGSDAIDEAVKKAIKGQTDELSKAKAIDSTFKNHIFYNYYSNCKFSDIDKAWQNGHLNCADGANVLCAMFIAGGLKAVIIHTTGHYIVKVTIKGKAYYTDNAAATGSHTSRAFGSVWRGITSGSEVGTKIEA